jgi:hypothetical protein
MKEEGKRKKGKGEQRERRTKEESGGQEEGEKTQEGWRKIPDRMH